MTEKTSLIAALLSEAGARVDELINLTSGLLRLNSENPPGNSRPISECIAAYLRTAGIESIPHVAPGDHWNLLAEVRGGRPGKRLLFAGHTDVVPAGDLSRWDFLPCAGDIVDGYLRGRGASDMKAGLAGMLFAIAVLSQVRAHLPGSLGVAVADDEETGGHNGVRWLLDQGLVHGDGCVIGEPSDPMHPTIGQKGSCWFQVTFHGAPAHGSIAPLGGDNAILKAAIAVQQLQKLYQTPVTVPDEIAETVRISKQQLREQGRAEVADILDHVSVNVGIIRGGTKANIVPDTCTIEVDTRVPFGLTHHDVLAQARQLLDQLGFAYETSALSFQGPANYTSPQDPVVRALLAGIRDARGGEPYGVLQWASSDARWFRRHGIPVLQYGPAELGTIHAFNERVKVEDVMACAKVYIATAIEYLYA